MSPSRTGTIARNARGLLALLAAGSMLLSVPTALAEAAGGGMPASAACAARGHSSMCPMSAADHAASLLRSLAAVRPPAEPGRILPPGGLPGSRPPGGPQEPASCRTPAERAPGRAPPKLEQSLMSRGIMQPTVYG